jgi:hypothetical protein
MQKQLTAAGIDYAPFFTERTRVSIQFEVRRFCNGHAEFRCEEPYIQQKVYLAIQRAAGAGRYRPEFICRDGSLTSPQTFAKGILRTRMAHMHCDLLEERHGRPPMAPAEPASMPTQSTVIELASPAIISADVVSARLARSEPAGAYVSRDSGMSAATGGAVISLAEAIQLNGDIIDPHPSPFEVLDAQERQNKISAAVASMVPDVRAAWNGLPSDGIGWSELGRRKGLSDNGARKRYEPKFLDAFLAVGLDEYYGGDTSDTVGCVRAGFASNGSAIADGLCDSRITAGCTGRPVVSHSTS